MGKKKKFKINRIEEPKVNPELKGFDIKIDSFGEIKSTYDIDKINEFLNKHVDDKKLRDRDGIENGNATEGDEEDEK
jgi:hypothetical protein